MHAPRDLVSLDLLLEGKVLPLHRNHVVLALDPALQADGSHVSLLKMQGIDLADEADEIYAEVDEITRKRMACHAIIAPRDLACPQQVQMETGPRLTRDAGRAHHSSPPASAPATGLVACSTEQVTSRVQYRAGVQYDTNLYSGAVARAQPTCVAPYARYLPALGCIFGVSAGAPILCRSRTHSFDCAVQGEQGCDHCIVEACHMGISWPHTRSAPLNTKLTPRTHDTHTAYKRGRAWGRVFV
jgi:hypothetical protein